MSCGENLIPGATDGRKCWWERKVVQVAGQCERGTTGWPGLREAPGSPHYRLITMNVEHEVGLLVEEIRRLGTKGNDGKLSVKFGVLFNDDKCANLFEALVGTLKAAKRRKIVTYSGELLLQGVHDNTDIVLLQD
ncbi:costars family protein ABRACL isoform X1 [Phyllobates terribilis]|uniref:costars family protein ABRACL isoform X1 n=2 Tax=Phyllobates terribilis TaxID=111132 RepID=UPI003CCA9F03